MDGWQVDGDCDGDCDGDDDDGDGVDDVAEEDGGEGCEAPNNLANRASL